MGSEKPRDSVLKYRNSVHYNSPWTLAKVFVTAMTAAPFLLMFSSLVFSIYAILWTNYGFIPVCYIAWLLYDRHTYSRGGRSSHWYKNLSVWNHSAKYFDIKLVKTANLDSSKNYLLCAHPHGVIPVGVVGAIGTEVQNISELFPGVQFTVLTDAVFNWAPFFRENFHLLGCCSADKESMDYLLSQEGGGQAPVLFPGGATEAIESQPNSNVLYLKNRKGFVKLALRHGTPLVPVFTFGETDILKIVPNPEGSILRYIQNIFLRIRRVPIFVFTSAIPRQVPVTTVVGAPIPVAKTPEPSQEEIDFIHSQYIKSLSDLYYKHRELYAPNPKVDLVFI